MIRMIATRLVRALLFVTCSAIQAICQTPSANLPPVTFTAAQDHQNMLDQLGIKSLRPGPSGNEKAPNHANTDESLANPYPDLPDPLTLIDGRKVATPDMWWHQRRPQIVELYEDNVYGRLPANLPHVTWTITATDHEFLGFTRVIARDLIGTVDNAAYPAISVKIHMTMVTPETTTTPVPLLIMFGRAGFPNPAEPSSEDFDRINAAQRALLLQQDPSLKDALASHPAWQPFKPTPMFQPPQLNADGDPPNTWELAAAGWGFVLLDPTSIQADDGAGLTRGIIGLVNHGQPRSPSDWGALRAWAWGAGQAFDYLTTDPTISPAIDAQHIGIDGVSRYGKAALVTMAFDQRFAMGLIGSSGKGGATPLRRNFGEAVESLTGGEYYWMAGNFIQFGGPKTPNDIPVDSNELIALCAPRLTFISYGIPEKGDAKWLDQQGSFMATVDASRVFTLLGVKGLSNGMVGVQPNLGPKGSGQATTASVSTDYHHATMPPVNTSLLGGHLAWRQHDGGHTDAPNMKFFIHWVDISIGHSAP
jgi:hypothetical protein